MRGSVVASPRSIVTVTVHSTLTESISAHADSESISTHAGVESSADSIPAETIPSETTADSTPGETTAETTTEPSLTPTPPPGSITYCPFAGHPDVYTLCSQPALTSSASRLRPFDRMRQTARSVAFGLVALSFPFWQA